jgi:phosphate transport system protein
MRDRYHDELNHIGRALVEMTDLVDSALRSATIAVLEVDLRTAELVIERDATIDQRRTQIEELALDLLARQQPVAGDLRTILSALRIVSSLERMGDLALHIAKIARMRYPEPALPPTIRPMFAEMAEVAHDLTVKARRLLEEHDLAIAAELEAEDDRMDTLHRALFGELLHGWEYGIEAAIDATLLGRYYERYGDHAVSLARRVVQLVSGTLPAHA